MPARRNRRNRNRQRKPRAAAVETEGAATGAVAAPPRPRNARDRARETAVPARAPGVPRPRAPWHPLPLAEILIVAGAVATAVGVLDGPSRAAPALFGGLGAVALGTVDVTLREHLAGYRSHAVLLATLVVIVMHTVIVVALSAVTRVPGAANAALVALDVGVFIALQRILRVRYVEARRARFGRVPR
jgi:hypothetical protein